MANDDSTQTLMQRSRINPLRRVRVRPLLLALTGAIAVAVASAGAGVAAAASGSAAAASVQFKLSGEIKFHEQAAVAKMARSIGLAAPVSLGNRLYSVTTNDEAAALSAASALRERGSVLWAQSARVGRVDAPLVGAKTHAEFHRRMLALTLAVGADANATVAALSQRTGQALKLRRVSGSGKALVLLPKGTTAASLAAVAVAATTVSGVQSADRMQMARHQWIPNDTMFAQQWSLGSGAGGIRAAQSWDLTPSGTVAVAVIDTGIRPHPELDNKRMAGYDMIASSAISIDGDGRDADPTDVGDFDDALECDNASEWNFMSSWHGTHVAGIIAASSNNGVGMAGVAPNARIVPVRALGVCGGTFEDIADSIRWAAGVPVAGVPANLNPAKVINLSLGGTAPCSDDMQAAVDGAIGRGASVIVAAGNELSNVAESSPANCKGVIAVAASNLLGDLASYSNFGLGVAITAPGGDSGNMPGVISTLNGGITDPAVPSYATYSGTSMAAPHVAGVVALMLTRDPMLTPGQILNRLTGGARSFVPGSDCAAVAGACGSGLLDAANAVGSVSSVRPLNDLAATPDRMRLVELRDTVTGRYLLTADPVELTSHTSGARGNVWVRTGYSMDTFSFTAQGHGLSFAQPVCRARLIIGAAYVYSTNVEECADYRKNSGYAVDGMAFAAALPSTVCSLGTAPVIELLQVDARGYNTRAVQDQAEISRMLATGWAQSRIAFCVPQ
jgi:serine protease